MANLVMRMSASSRGVMLSRRLLMGASASRASDYLLSASGYHHHIFPATSTPRLFSTASSTEDKPQEPLSTSNSESKEFQAETRQLLDIVTHSLYTDKEVFLRELVSNASDALEKLRLVQSSGDTSTIDADVPLEIRIETDEMNGTLTVSDTGIGLTRDEMVSNLGTIAKSGSKAFMEQMAHNDSNSIIGKFGVGFYSAFMVGDSVEVRSKSAVENSEDDTPQVWTSTGHGSFEVADLNPDVRQDRGSSVVIHLKEDELQYSDEKTIENILKKYSNFVSFPIYLNGNRVNTMEAVWSMEPKDVSDEVHDQFYKFIAHAMDEPLDKLHFRADAPLEIKALLYIPSFHSEKYGMGRMEPGVGLYSRKVLIESKSPDILPDWLRFIRGVVDSEDLPLSISREKAQDSSLIAKLRKVLTRKFISHLTTMAKKNPDLYQNEFYREYNYFLKEGICQDFEFQESLAKLLYFESSKQLNLDLSSLDDYIGRMKPEQKDIYYLCAPSRDLAVMSPYLEAFEKAGVEVLFVYTAIDDFCMANLGTYQGRTLVSAEKGDIDLEKFSDKDNDDKQEETVSLSDQDAFCAWLKMTLGEDKVTSVKVTTRLNSSPAVVTDNESGAMRRMMRMVDTQDNGGANMPLPKQQVEINPNHSIIVGIDSLRETEPALAKVCAEQVFDNCLVAAGLLDDGRSMLPRLNDILLSVLRGAQANRPETESNPKDAVEEAAGDKQNASESPEGNSSKS